jgi:hypothetical protein
VQRNTASAEESASASGSSTPGHADEGARGGNWPLSASAVNGRTGNASGWGDETALSPLRSRGDFLCTRQPRRWHGSGTGEKRPLSAPGMPSLGENPVFA